MIVNLNKLVESLEYKYNIPSQKLNEKFSDDVPEWFSKRVLTTKYTPTSNFRKRDVGARGAHVPTYLSTSKAQKKNPEEGKYPEYRQVNDYAEDQSLFSGLLDRGISLDTLKIIEGPIPKSENDKRLQPPNIPIFLFDNGVVYAKGINDDEKLGGRKTLGAYDTQSLLDKCKKFAYIDGNDPNNFLRPKRRSDRSSNHLPNNYYRVDGPEKDRNGRSFVPYSYYGADKSGYAVIPPADKYKEKVAELKASKIYDTMKEYEDFLTDSQQELANYMSQLDIKDEDGYYKVRQLVESLKHCIVSYINVDKEINSIITSSSNDEEKKQNLIRLIKGVYPYYQTYGALISRINDFKAESQGIFNATIDWI